jgi:hypothetical protein|tara:strand:- start:204 stop:437 length:234 start_codon:yes stop_codon:yes gene_type:complete
MTIKSKLKKVLISASLIGILWEVGTYALTNYTLKNGDANYRNELIEACSSEYMPSWGKALNAGMCMAARNYQDISNK